MAVTEAILPPCKDLPREMLETGLPEHVFERMEFLWKAAHHLRLSSPAASRMYSDQLRKLAADQDATSAECVLPDWIREAMCSSCGSVLTPGVNCRVRVRSRSLSSPSVKKATKNRNQKHSAIAASSAGTGGAAASTKRPRKCRNEVVATCALCNAVARSGGTERRAHHNKRRKGMSAGETESEAELFTPTSDRASQVSGKVGGKLRGNFIPLGNASMLPPQSTPNNPRRVPPKHSKATTISNRRSSSSGMKDGFSSATQDAFSAQGSKKKSANVPGTASKNTKAGPTPAGNRGVGGFGSNSGSSSTKKRGSGPGRGASAGRGAAESAELGIGGAVPVKGCVSGSLSNPANVIFASGGFRVGEGSTEGKGHGAAQPRELSLLEKIQKNAKKKRRQAAAAGSGGSSNNTVGR